MGDITGRYNQLLISSFCGPWSLRFSLRYVFLKRENHNVDPHSEWGWIKVLQGKLKTKRNVRGDKTIEKVEG